MANIGVPVDPVEDGENDIAMLYAIPCRSWLASDSGGSISISVG